MTRLRLAALLPLIALAIVAWWWLVPPDPVRELRARARQLTRLERRPAPELGAGVERWRMIAAGGETVTGLWKPGAANGGRPAWSVVMLGGIGTDERAAVLVPDSLPVNVLAVSWPWKGSRHLSRLAFLLDVPAIHEALLRTPAAVARGIEAVRQAEPGGRVALVGVSLGVPPTAAALSLATPDALALVDGAADLPRLLRAETSRTLAGNPARALLAPAAAALAARLTRSLEPARHPAPAALPVLLLDAAHDPLYPPQCIARLHAAYPGATRAVHAGGHVRPDDPAAVAAIASDVWRWLRAVPAR